MKSLSTAFAAHLASGATTLAWCWRITRADGEVYGFTDHDRPLSFDGTAFEPDAGLIPAEIRNGTDLSVDAQDAEGVLKSDTITEADILDGRWDDAEVEVWRVNWETPAQRALLRCGAIGQIRRGRVAFVAEVRGLAHVLGQTIGRSFQGACDAALGDGRCGVDLESAAFKGAGAVISVDGRVFSASGIGGFDSGWFASGAVSWSSGANAGRMAEIMSHVSTAGVTTISLLEAPIRAIEPGDAFTIRAGCDKSIATCAAKFANVPNFRGFPHIPGQDAVIRYATKNGQYDGEPL